MTVVKAKTAKQRQEEHRKKKRAGDTRKELRGVWVTPAERPVVKGAALDKLKELRGDRDDDAT